MKRKMNQKIAAVMAAVLCVTSLGITTDGVLTGTVKANAAETPATLTPVELDTSDSDSGTPANPIEIYSAGELLKLSQILEDNPDEVITSSNVKYGSASYKLAADIAINHGTANADGSFTMFDNSLPFVWKPIRNFSGKFDGNGKTISGLYLTEESAESLDGTWKSEGISQPATGSGLFGYTKNHAEISNLTISNSIIKLDSNNCETAHFAFITGYGDNTILKSCKVTGDCYINAKGSAWAEEIGYWNIMEGVMASYYNTVAGIGGIAGMLFNQSTVTDCQNAASINCQNIRLVGGITGYAGTTNITNSSNTGAVSGNQSVGGIVGAAATNGSSGKIENCENSGKITATEWTQDFYDANINGASTWSDELLCGNMAGGICGYNCVDISNCHNTADIAGNKMLGGIVGVSRIGIYNSMNEGNVTASDWAVVNPASKGSADNAAAGCQAGGIVGSIGTDFYPVASNSLIQIESCSNIGTVSAANASDTLPGSQSSYGGIAGWGHCLPSAPPAASAAPVTPVNIVSCYTAANGQPESKKAFSSQVDITSDTANGIYPASAVNSFYLASAADENGGRTKTQFESGAVAYELNQVATAQSAKNTSSVSWYQRLKDSSTQKADAWPVSYKQGSSDCIVYRATLNVGGNPVYLYFNPGWTVAEILENNAGATGGDYQLYDSTTGNVIAKDTVFNNDFSCDAKAAYTVEIVEPADAHMTRKADSGQTKQSGLTGKMTDVIYTADDGYYFPDNYTVNVSDGITVTRNSSTQITISGTPTKDIKFTLVAAAKTQTTTPPVNPGGPSTVATPTPTAVPTPTPTAVPTITPGNTPSAVPTTVPTVAPSTVPTQTPAEPTADATQTPGQTTEPTAVPPETDSPMPSATPIGTDMPKGTNFKQGGLSYKTSSGNSVALSRVPTSAAKGNFKLPDTVTVSGKTYKVTTVAANTFAGNKKIQNITLGKNITKLGKNSFKGCSNLKKVKFNNKVKVIGAACFANCKKLKSVALPDSITHIGNKAFKNCTGLKTAKIGKTRSDKKVKTGALSETTVTNTVPAYSELKLNISIGNNVFENCKNLKSVIINSAVSVIGNSAFKNCMKLSDIIVRSLILKTVAKKALVGVTNCKIAVPTQKFAPYRKLFKNKGQGKKVFVAKA